VSRGLFQDHSRFPWTPAVHRYRVVIGLVAKTTRQLFSPNSSFGIIVYIEGYLQRSAQLPKLCR
jgi:hypothetical protein